MGRQVSRQIVSLTGDPATSERIPFSDRAGGMVFLPSDFNGSQIDFYATHEAGGTPGMVHKGDGTASGVVALIASTPASIPIPIECFGAAELIITTDASTGLTVIVTLKD